MGYTRFIRITGCFGCPYQDLVYVDEKGVPTEDQEYNRRGDDNRESCYWCKKSQRCIMKVIDYVRMVNKSGEMYLPIDIPDWCLLEELK